MPVTRAPRMNRTAEHRVEPARPTIGFHTLLPIECQRILRFAAEPDAGESRAVGLSPERNMRIASAVQRVKVILDGRAG